MSEEAWQALALRKGQQLWHKWRIWPPAYGLASASRQRPWQQVVTETGEMRVRT
jgi:hypothetical protein